MMKLAMICFDEVFVEWKKKAKLIIQVHDEVVLDCPEHEMQSVREIVVESMEKAFDGIIEMSVPLKVNVETGRNWMDL